MLTVLLVTIEAATVVVNMTFIKHGHGSPSCFLYYNLPISSSRGNLLFARIGPDVLLEPYKSSPVTQSLVQSVKYIFSEYFQYSENYFD